MKAKTSFHTTKKTPVAMKKFAPKVLGNERGKLLSDDEMVGMHNYKSKKGYCGKTSSAAAMPRATMMFNSREA